MTVKSTVPAGPVYILASNFREATEIARVRGLRASRWRIYGRNTGRGPVGITVLVTPCWSHWRAADYIDSVQTNLRVSRAVIKKVRCP